MHTQHTSQGLSIGFLSFLTHKQDPYIPRNRFTPMPLKWHFLLVGSGHWAPQGAVSPHKWAPQCINSRKHTCTYIISHYPCEDLIENCLYRRMKWINILPPKMVTNILVLALMVLRCLAHMQTQMGEVRSQSWAGTAEEVRNVSVRVSAGEKRSWLRLRLATVTSEVADMLTARYG